MGWFTDLFKSSQKPIGLDGQYKTSAAGVPSTCAECGTAITGLGQEEGNYVIIEMAHDSGFQRNSWRWEFCQKCAQKFMRKVGFKYKEER
jgi:hypothetical protein